MELDHYPTASSKMQLGSGYDLKRVATGAFSVETATLQFTTGLQTKMLRQFHRNKRNPFAANAGGRLLARSVRSRRALKGVTTVAS